MSGLEPGIRGEARLTVGHAESAAALGSGTLPVLGTPALLALMERAASESVQPFLEPGMTSVGTRILLEHVSATPLSMAVRCETELKKVEGRLLTFSCQAYDAAGLVGTAEQERVIVKSERFLMKAEEKRG